MAKVQAPRPSQEDADECLHCTIIDMVDERIAQVVRTLPSSPPRIAESLVDLILRMPEEEQANDGAHTIGFGRSVSSEERR